MKKTILTGIIFSALLYTLTLSSEIMKLRVKVTNIESDKGKVMVALYNSKESYENGKSEPYRYASLEIQKGESNWEVDSLPAGEYAIKLYHDENDNQKMDKNIVGIPKESYGFSNNAPARFGPPSFEDAAFQVDKEETIQVIKIN